MRAVPDNTVLDANLFIKLFVPTADSPQARDCFSFLTTGQINTTLHAPSLLFIECANALWKYARFAKYPVNDICRHISKLMSYPFNIIPCESIIEDALQVACQFQVSVYDECYVVAANNNNATLVTADKRLVTQLSSSSYQVELLADFSTSIQ